jgi:putative mRNA 3-end processing factor
MALFSSLDPRVATLLLMPTPVIEATDRGLYCAAGGFFIDPWQPVDRAIITHGHGDHARPGSQRYLGAAPGREILRARLGADAMIEGIPYGEKRTIGKAILSFHPAGHILGSAQVRVEVAGETWVVSGDYKVAPDPTCAAFEPVPCDVFITESTFGLPIYRWPAEDGVFQEIHKWWRECRESGRTAVLFTYALGKAQRILHRLDSSHGPILLHGAIEVLCEAYQREGVRFPRFERATVENAKLARGRAMVIAPVSAIGSPWLRKFGSISRGFASGWMQVRGARRRRSIDRGFILSDHADWDGINTAIAATGARTIGVTHGYSDILARWLSERGYEPRVYRTLYEGESGAEDAGASPAQPADN